jgi:hypothetical protein
MDPNELMRYYFYDEYKNKIRRMVSYKCFDASEISIKLADSVIAELAQIDSHGNKIIDDNDYTIEHEFNHPIYEADLAGVIRQVFDEYLDSKYNRFGSINVLSKRPNSVTLELRLRH